jgi:hypothetical protein
MKNLAFLTLLVWSLVSCKSNDETIIETATIKDLEGTWILKETFYGMTNSRNPSNGQTALEFRTDGSFMETYSKAIRDMGKYTLKDSPRAGDTRRMIVYNNELYQYYWFEKEKLHLYPENPLTLGIEIADGGVKIYEKR